MKTNRIVSAVLLSFTLLALMTLPVMGAEVYGLELSPAESFASRAYGSEGTAVSAPSGFYELTLQGVTASSSHFAYARGNRVWLSLTARGDAPTVRDASTEYAGESLGASVQHGALILEKRVGTRRDFVRVGTLVNLFEDNPYGIPELYVLSSDDLREGVTLRITVLWCSRQDPPLRHTDVYEITVARPDSYLYLTMASGQSDLCDHGTVTEEDGGILCEFGRDMRVELSYNDSDFVEITSGTRVDRIGRYRFRGWAYDGSRIQKTVYIIPSAERAMEVYFPKGAVEGVYIFDGEATVPTYLKGAVLTVPQVSPYLPPLTGRMMDGAGKVRELSAGDRVLLTAGEYTVILTAGEATSGLTDLFTFRFRVWEAYAESVNHTILKANGMALPSGFCLLTADTDRAVARPYPSEGSEGVELTYGVPLAEQLEAGEWILAEYQGDVLLDVYRIRIPETKKPLEETSGEPVEETAGAHAGEAAGVSAGQASCRASLFPCAWLPLVALPILLKKRKEEVSE